MCKIVSEEKHIESFFSKAYTNKNEKICKSIFETVATHTFDRTGTLASTLIKTFDKSKRTNDLSEKKQVGSSWRPRSPTAYAAKTDYENMGAKPAREASMILHRAYNDKLQQSLPQATRFNNALYFWRRQTYSCNAVTYQNRRNTFKNGKFFQDLLLYCQVSTISFSPLKWMLPRKEWRYLVWLWSWSLW